MDKYINANKLEKDGWTMQRIRQASSTEMVYEVKKPTDFPAADVVEVRNGRWKQVGDNTYRCSVCGELSCCCSPYCGECGAKMDEVLT